jgi:hypothetical protein
VALAILASFEGHRTEVARFYQTELGWDTPLDVLKLKDPRTNPARRFLTDEFNAQTQDNFRNW